MSVELIPTGEKNIDSEIIQEGNAHKSNTTKNIKKCMQQIDLSKILTFQKYSYSINP